MHYSVSNSSVLVSENKAESAIQGVWSFAPNLEPQLPVTKERAFRTSTFLFINDRLCRVHYGRFHTLYCYLIKTEFESKYLA